MDPEERRVRAQHLKEIIFSRNPGDWVDDQLADIAELRESRSAGRRDPRFFTFVTLRQHTSL